MNQRLSTTRICGERSKRRSAMKRVLHISKYYYPFLGGTEQVARDIAKSLIDVDGIEQKIICFNEDAEKDGVKCAHQQTVHDTVDGIEVIRCGYQIKVSSQALSLSYRKELKKIISVFKPDIIFLHYPNPFVTHFLLKYIDNGTKLYVYWHLDITKQKILKKFFHKQNIRLINRATKILGATPKHLDESAYTPYFSDKKYILPYTIDEESLVLDASELKRADEIKKQYDGDILGFFIGRHVPYKGLKYLIEASKIINDIKVKFLIAGTGELTEDLKEQAKGDDKIIFLGKISDSDRRAYLKACDIVCFPSITRNEGFGLALAEGMYFGKPAVTFTIPGSGVNYVNLNGVTGIECPNSDSDAYAKAVVKLCEDEKIRKQYGINARKRILDNFTQVQFKKNIIQLINEE